MIYKSSNISREYYNEVHRDSKVFESGKSVNYGGRSGNAEELVNLIDSSLDFWLTAGPWAHKLESGIICGVIKAY